MDFKQAVAAAEAVLFAAGDPVSVERLCLALGMGKDEVRETLAALSARLENTESGIKLVRVGERYQLCTRSEFSEQIRAALETRKQPALSASALEVLSIIAYRQPVTRVYIEQVRGVDSSYTVSSLAEKGFIEECGRLEVPGRPILFRTTAVFLRVFGLDTLEDLPPLPEGDENGQLPLASELALQREDGGVG